jgi:hypothetical protein
LRIFNPSILSSKIKLRREIEGFYQNIKDLRHLALELGQPKQVFVDLSWFSITQGATRKRR